MPIRNGWRPGHYLMVDDESGRVYWDDEVVRKWDGLFFRLAGNEDEIARHPQEFIRAKKDPKPLKHVRPLAPTSAASFVDIDQVADTGITLPTGAAQHLFQTHGIGVMIVGGGNSAERFIVR